MADLLDDFTFRLLIPERNMSRQQISVALCERGYGDDVVRIIGSVNRSTLLVSVDEEKTMEMVLLFGAEIERVDWSKHTKGIDMKNQEV